MDILVPKLYRVVPSLYQVLFHHDLTMKQIRKPLHMKSMSRRTFFTYWPNFCNNLVQLSTIFVPPVISYTKVCMAYSTKTNDH